MSVTTQLRQRSLLRQTLCCGGDADQHPLLVLSVGTQLDELPAVAEIEAVQLDTFDHQPKQGVVAASIGQEAGFPGGTHAPPYLGLGMNPKDRRAVLPQHGTAGRTFVCVVRWTENRDVEPVGLMASHGGAGIKSLVTARRTACGPGIATRRPG